MNRAKQCRWCARTAFLLSGLLHAALVLALLPVGAGGGGSDASEGPVGVRLHMFEGPSAADGEPQATPADGEHSEAAPDEPEVAADPPPAAPPPAPKLEPDSEAEPEAKPEPLPSPVESMRNLRPVESDPEPPRPLAVAPEPAEVKVTAEPPPEPAPEPEQRIAPPPESAPAPKRVQASLPRAEPPRQPDAALKPPRAEPPRRAAASAPTSDTPTTRSGRAGAGRSTAVGGYGRPGGGSPGNAGLESRYLADLQRAIAGHRFYPSAARRRGLEGTTTLHFVIESDGRLTGVRVVDGSGSALLDDAALETLARLGRFRPIPAGVERSRWPVQVPIRFGLR